MSCDADAKLLLLLSSLLLLFRALTQFISNTIDGVFLQLTEIAVFFTSAAHGAIKRSSFLA